MADYGVVTRKLSFNISDMLFTLGATGFLLSSMIYFGVVSFTVQVPITHEVGFLASFAMMAVSFALAAWTAGAKSITFFGLVEWLVTIALIVWMLFPFAFGNVWEAYHTVNSLGGVVVSSVWWTLAVRDNR